MSGLTDAGYPAIRGIKITGLHCEGARSEWFVGQQTALGRPVAVKRLKAGLAGSFDMRQAFINAGRQAAGIVHPSALAIINLFPDQDAIVMEWCEMLPLRDLEGKLSALDAAKVGIAVMDGLAGLHATDRAHGNLGPGNVFMNLDGQIRINDFFQPPIIDDSDPAFASGKAFAAPEILSGRKPDWRSDVYSLGKLLARVIDPSEQQEDTAKVIEEMCSPRPDLRAEAPWSAHQRLLKAKRLEERRRGIASPTLARRQRRYRRIPAELSVSVRKRSATPVETAAILSKIRDIGENGVFVSTDDPMGIGSIVELNFALQGDAGMIHAFGLVRWVAEPPLTPGMGVQFVEVDGIGVESLREYLRNRGAGAVE